ncbi:MAG: Gfo/Idh/MocA family oxidoreductase [Gammaproteobacteria bacterium]|nr:Gfo/Idh/MocA family oxidoreductase [Gammaproteobacteria bacterium]
MPKICVVGGGRWGQNHVRTLDGLDFLGGVCDVSQASLEKYADLYPHVPGYSSLDDALGAGFDGFTVATPAQTHFDIASKIMRAGFPVLVEKPLALSSDEARKLYAISKECEQQLMVGHLMLFHPAIEKIKQLVDSGKIGKVQYIYSNRINLGTVRTEENILWSFAPHDISIFQYLLGTRPLEVVSRGGAHLQPGVHDSTMTILRYPGNVMCHNYVSWLHPFKEHRIVVMGNKGMLRFDDSSEDKALLFYERGIDWINGEPIKREGVTETLVYGDEQPLTAELNYFVENMNKKIEKADGQNAIEVLEILELATAQIEGAEEPTLSANVAANAIIGKGVKIHESAYVDDGCVIGDKTKVWHYSHVQQNASIGTNCSLGQSVNIGSGVKIGNDVRIQNNVSVFEGVEIEDYVFCGPSMTFTNVLNPRAKYPVGVEKYGKTLVKEGASIGANATIVCGNTIGCYAFIAAGAVVTKDVPDYAFMIGVPARQQGWVTETGDRFDLDVGEFVCETSGKRYSVEAGAVVTR